MGTSATYEVRGVKPEDRRDSGWASAHPVLVASGLTTRVAADAVIRAAVEQGWSGLTVTEERTADYYRLDAETEAETDAAELAASEERAQR